MKTILFDLDGTLLPMDVQKFMFQYKISLEKHFSTLHSEANLFEKVMSSVKHVVKDQGPLTNDIKFFDHFFRDLKVSKDNYLEHFDLFYKTNFEEVKTSTSSSETMIEAIKILKSKGYDLMILTNPIFPMVANQKRIQWAGLDINDFKYVSSFEKNTACKPFLKFYEEVLEINALNSDEVLMVGNDAQEDLVVQKLGIKTFLINNHLINREASLPYTDYSGSYDDFKSFVEALPEIRGEK